MTISNINLLKNKIIFFLVLGIVSIYLLVRMRYNFDYYDTGLLLYGSERVLEGFIPYKDFWFVYTPGNLYLFALLFKITGPSLISAYTFNAIISILVVITTFIISREIISNQIALLVLIFLTTLWVGFTTYINVTMPLLLSLMTCSLFLKYVKHPKKIYLLILGVLLGLITIFRVDFGLYAFLIFTIMLILRYIWINKSNHELSQIIEFFKSWILVLIISLLVLVPVFIYFLCMVPFSDLVTQLIVFPLKIYPSYRQLPFPTFTVPRFIPMYFPSIIFIITLVWILYRKLKNKLEFEKDYVVIFLLVFGIIFSSYALVRTDYIHMYPVMIPAIILFAYFFSINLKSINNFRVKNIRNIDQIRNSIAFLFSILVILLFFCTSISPVLNQVDNITYTLDNSRLDGIYISGYDFGDGKNFINTVNYLRNEVPLKDKIFVGNYRTDKLIINNAMLYFLSEHESGTKYNDLHPGVATTTTVQNEIIQELKTNDVKYIVLWNETSTMEPNKSSQSSGVRNLDEYIHHNYHIIKIFGNYKVLKLDVNN